MRFVSLVFLCMAFLITSDLRAAFADTPTPTAPPTTPAPTPDTLQAWVIGSTPGPGQPVGFSYSATAGQGASAFMYAVLLFSLWAITVIVLLVRRKEST